MCHLGPRPLGLGRSGLKTRSHSATQPKPRWRNARRGGKSLRRTRKLPTIQGLEIRVWQPDAANAFSNIDVFPIDPPRRTHNYRAPLRKIPLVIAILLCVWLGLSGLVKRHDQATQKIAPVPRAVVPVGAGADIAAPVIAPLPAPPLAVAPPFPEPLTRQTVFRLKLDHDRCTLEKVEEVSGSFGRERAVKWQAGMLCCRLVAGDGRIVGERTIPAPDQVCVVLDPNVSGAPSAARLTSDGPAVFQIRFPNISGAERLEVYRIATEIRPADSAASIGPLVASIPIPVE